MVSRRSFAHIARFSVAAATVVALSTVGLGPALAFPRAAHVAPAGARVGVVPAPGDRYAPAGTSITFRGASVAELAGLSVIGSKTGRHSGSIAEIAGGGGALK